jgi:hypothetical protein
MKWFPCIVAVSLVVAAALGTSSVATAASISVVNATFADPVLANGSDAPVAFNANPTAVNGWAWVGGGLFAGIWNIPGADAPDSTNGLIGASGDGTPQGGNGANVMYFQTPAAGGDCPAVVQALSVGVAVGTYTLTVAEGVSSQRTALDTTIIGLCTPGMDSNTYLGSLVTNQADQPGGSLTDRTLTVNIGSDSPYLGQQLLIRLTGTSAADERIEFANVRLDGPLGPIVPEPNTLVLSVMGLVGLLCYAWRKRR